MNRTYELMFIVRPDMPDEDLDKLIATLQSVVPASAEPCKKSTNGQAPSGLHCSPFHDGIYVLWPLRAAGRLIHELERRLRVTEPVIKFLTVRADEEQKRLDKIKKLRDSKKKVSAQPAAQDCACSGGGSSGYGVSTNGCHPGEAKTYVMLPGPADCGDSLRSG